jgi:hypothetical protein
MTAQEFDQGWQLLKDLKWYYDLHSAQADKLDTEQTLEKRVDDFILQHMAEVYSRRTQAQVERENQFHNKMPDQPSP